MIWGNGFRDLGPSNGGVAPPRTACSRAGGECGRGSPPPAEGVRGCDPPKFFFEIFDAKSRVWGQFGPENKLIEGQPDEYDVTCRNASVLAFHLWPTMFAGAPIRLQNIAGGPATRLARASDSTSAEQVPSEMCRRRSALGDNEVG